MRKRRNSKTNRGRPESTLGRDFTETERARERFSATSLSQEAAAFLQQALARISSGTFNAIAALQRRAAHALCLCVTTSLDAQRSAAAD